VDHRRRAQDKSLFAMIRNTHQLNPQVDRGVFGQLGRHGRRRGRALVPAWRGPEVRPPRGADPHADEGGNAQPPDRDLAVPGASTGAGGEIRDEGATGRGAKPKAGLTGFTVSNLMLPDAVESWENARDAAQPVAHRNPDDKPVVTGKPDRIASPLQIMIDGPLGGAAFNNEFGRANLGGYFRVYEQNVGGTVRGYHKPIMIAGGLGNIDGSHTHKDPLPAGALLIQLGGPGMRIGMGGGAASSMATGTNTADLDFDSVQRGNPEMERRAQEVINACWQLGDENPILSIHDVGAGGISNAFPELVDGADRGARFDLRRCTWKSRACRLPRSGATSRKSATCWRSRRTVCRFQAMCERERSPFAVVGIAPRRSNSSWSTPMWMPR
jgi:phosphoribosylformylglycinamidine synthase